jgi:hypothetical protein
MMGRRYRQARVVFYVSSGLVGLFGQSSPAFGQSETEPSPPQSQSSIAREKLQAARRQRGIFLDNESGTLIGIEGYAGISTLSMSGKRWGRALTGGLLRTRVGHFEFGGAIDQSDYADGQWRSLGGFVGLYLPYVNWVDVDATAGFSVRRHENHDRRYGPHGATVSVPALTLQWGISERSNPYGLFGVRLGAALFAQVDVARKNASWNYEVENRIIAAGKTSFGGTTIGLLMHFGFDLAFRPN